MEHISSKMDSETRHFNGNGALGDVGRLTRTCVYDRAGMGYSSLPSPKPHPIRQMVHELHALLERAGVSGPYVLVGQSLGGVNVRLFQSEHPDEVVGMVLVDVTPEDTVAEKDPEPLRAAMRDDAEGVDYDTFLAGLADLRASRRTLGDMPLVVLTHGLKPGRPPGVTEEELDEAERTLLSAHEQMARLSTNSVHLVAQGAGHMVHIDAPHLVIASVKQVVVAARAHSQLDAKALEPWVKEGSLVPWR
jgi:pimeloyl-ACP methyl ester carboxylesterase